MFKKLILASAFILVALFCQADLIIIPSDYATIQEGINASTNGDTVLVKTGTYIENVNFNGKNITLGSLFLTTQDTSYISQTIIDGNRSGSVVTFDSGEDSTAIITGFTLTNGIGTHTCIPGFSYYYFGGGIFIANSEPNIHNLVVTNNIADWGAGICIASSSATFKNIDVKNNIAYIGGGGLIISYSDPIFEHVVVELNKTNGADSNIQKDFVFWQDYKTDREIYGNSGGGIACFESNPTFNECIIRRNSCKFYGGGILSIACTHKIINSEISYNTSLYNDWVTYGGGVFLMYDSTSVFQNVDIFNNLSLFGGGVFVCCSSEHPIFKDVTIKENKATSVGGGIFCNDSSYVIFDETDRCNIFMNNSNTRSNGADIVTESAIRVIVDTFTVLNPTDYHAISIDSIKFDILHGKLDQVDADLYVAPWGDNNNSGLSSAQPLKTIQYATSIILADSLNRHTINLASGTYSPSVNGEFFPINLPNYVSLIGDTSGVILDAENSASVFKLQKVDVELHNLIIKNGYARDGGGIYSFVSKIKIQNVQIINNESTYDGGGILAYSSDITLLDAVVCDNTSLHDSYNGGGGGIFLKYSTMKIDNSTIGNNSALYNAGGIYIGYFSSCIINSSIISGNNKYGIYAHWNYDDVDITYSNFWNNEEGNFYGLNDSIGVNVSTNADGDSCDVFYNIQMDPKFVDPANSYYHLSWTNYPVQDSTKSPCIDAGDPDSPLDPDGTIADMGAYYYDQTLGIIPDPEIREISLMNYPNPFQRSTTISFAIPKATRVKLQIFNVKGQLAEEILNDDIQSGESTVEWDSADYPSGVYFYKLSTPQTSVINKMVIMK